MALTIADVSKGYPDGGPNKSLTWVVAEVTGDAAYAAGGYALTAASFGMSSIAAVFPISSSGVLLPVWIRSTNKLAFYKGASSTTVTTGSGGLTEASTNDTYVSSATALLLVLGRPA